MTTNAAISYLLTSNDGCLCSVLTLLMPTVVPIGCHMVKFLLFQFCFVFLNPKDLCTHMAVLNNCHYVRNEPETHRKEDSL